MFLFVVMKILSQIPINIIWHNQISIIISNQNILMFNLSFVSNFLSVILIPKIGYCIITVWNFSGINSLSIFSPYMIIFLFFKYFNVPTNHCFYKSAQFLTFTDSLLIFSFINNLKFFIHLVIIIHKKSSGLYCKICLESFNWYTE